MITIWLFSRELDILHNRILDIHSFNTVQVLLSPMVSGWASWGVSWLIARAGSV